MTKNILFTLTLILVSFFTIAQTSITGKVTDGETGEEMIGANILIKKNGVFVQGETTDIDGNYSVQVDPGTYDMEVSYTGYPTQKIADVVASAGQATKVDVQLKIGDGVMVDEIVVTEYKIPLIKQDMTASGSTVTSEHIRNLPTRDISKVAAATAGTSSSDEGESITIQGSRSNATDYYIDGKRVTGSLQGKVSGVEVRKHARKKSKKKRKTVRKERHQSGEEYDRIVENTFLSSKENPLSTFSIDVDNASYSNVRRFLNSNQMPPKDAVRIEEFINYFSYEYERPSGKTPFSINTEISDCPWNMNNKLVHIGLQSYELPKEQMPPSNLVFLLDVSGSMNASNKLPLLKKAFQLLVQQLRKEDKVSIVVYAGATGIVLSPTSGSDKNKITESLTRLRSSGGTAGAAGIRLAYDVAEKAFIKNGNNRIILATDGDFNVGTNSTTELVKLIEDKRKTGISISILGFGRGNYKDSKMEQIADNGNGNYSYIDNLQEAKKVFVQELGGTLHTIAKDVKLQIEFNPDLVQEYRLVGYENRKLKNEDFANDKKDAGDLGAGHTVTALYEIVPTNATNSSKKKFKNIFKRKNQQTGDDWMTINLRYKKPNEDVSTLLQVTAKDEGLSLEKSSDNFRFSAAVASFGMLLRDSNLKGDLNYDLVAQLAQGALGKDEHGYRKEFLTLIKKAKNVSSRMTARK